ncbi:hypothetical protein SAMN05216371_8267 [Streptomyces sp. TLI_053]|uniref:hypothetical protein n=1 Tax=Streptomyces sp. TLI_053 TaxID=1855352 RepID=UPI00087BABD2|nr:hypothetical protein [Streptomyces sp. TLI_053]SDT83438.1 hypothetical protein SAMN05216371_8267 [Streptomyces sp. TLI_053]
MGRDRLVPGKRDGDRAGRARRSPADLPPPPDQERASRRAWRRLFAVAPPLGAEHVQAAHELDLAVTLVLAQPAAAPSLRQLANSRRIHPEGALVLGALLQVTGRREAARFWWEFAAGAGSYTAASCLNLLHRSRGEIRDADWWREQAESLAANPRPATADAGAVLGASLLPAHVRDDIIARCHEGLDVRLPPRIAAVVHQLPVTADDEDHGEIPQPDPALLRGLAAAATAHPAPATRPDAPPILWYALHRHPSADLL